MLTDAFVKLRSSRAVQLFREFVRSPWYLALIAALMAISELFSLELPVMYVFVFFSILVFLFDEDLLGILPIFICHYLSISAANNLAKSPETETLFSDPAHMVQLIMLAAVYGVMILARLVSMLLLSGKKKAPELTFGAVFFGIALLMGGAFSGYWGGRSVLFGLLEIVCIFGIYLVFLYAVNWKTVPKGYGLMHLLTVGVGLAAEIVGMYFLPNAVRDTYINREALYVGWGIYNNVGAVMCMCVPAPFYFALKKKEGWIFSLLGIAFYLAVLIAQSRNAMLFGSVIFAACVVAVLVRAKGWERWKHLIVFAGFLVVAGISVGVFHDRMAILFRTVTDAGWNDSLRFDTYRACWKRFLEAPAFGSGFYHTPGTMVRIDTGEVWTTLDASEITGFLPPRAHNTIFQLLASGGIFMFVGYLVHRVQTGFLFYRHPTAEKTFLSFSVIALLLTSLLDCHFFSFGPALIYSVILAFAEGDNRRREVSSVFSLRELYQKIKRKGAKRSE